MNWRLILQLSLFGLFMGIGTVFFIPPNFETPFWLAIFVLCAYVIARQVPSRHFLHGFLVSVVNSVWVTIAQVVLFGAYAATHQRELEAMQALPVPPRLMMLIGGPIFGVLTGLVLGFFAWVASKLVRRAVA